MLVLDWSLVLRLGWEKVFSKNLRTCIDLKDRWRVIAPKQSAAYSAASKAALAKALKQRKGLYVICSCESSGASCSSVSESGTIHAGSDRETVVNAGAAKPASSEKRPRRQRTQSSSSSRRTYISSHRSTRRNEQPTDTHNESDGVSATFV